MRLDVTGCERTGAAGCVVVVIVELGNRRVAVAIIRLWLQLSGCGCSRLVVVVAAGCGCSSQVVVGFVVSLHA